MVNNKDVVMVSLVLIWNTLHNCSGVSFVDVEQVSAG